MGNLYWTGAIYLFLSNEHLKNLLWLIDLFHSSHIYDSKNSKDKVMPILAILTSGSLTRA